MCDSLRIEILSDRLSGVTEKVQIHWRVFSRMPAQDRTDQSRPECVQPPHDGCRRFTKTQQHERMLIVPENSLPFSQGNFDFPVSRQRPPIMSAKACRSLVFRRTKILEPMFLDQTGCLLCNTDS